jgi:hypothetical protein
LDGDLSDAKTMQQITALQVLIAGTIPESTAMRRSTGEDALWQESVQQTIDSVLRFAWQTKPLPPLELELEKGRHVV